MKIEKIFVINLDDKKHRYKKFEELEDSRLERFPAIDSRGSYKVCKTYGLNLDPVGLASEFYFSQAGGAVGAYLSHYRIWKKMIDEDIELALILEDDAKFSDVKKYIKKDKNKYDENFHFWQLGKRQWQDSLERICENFDGLESYVINKKGAEILVNSTHDCSHFQNIIECKPQGWFDGKKATDFSMFKNEPRQDWNKKYSITCAADKFVGYCAHPKIPEEKRLKIKILSLIDLHEQDISSDIMLSDDKPFWRRNETELKELIASDHFKYWKKDEAGMLTAKASNLITKSRKKVSLSICTYDSYDMLKLCLDSITRLSADKDTYEVIVLDNTPNSARKNYNKRELIKRSKNYIDCKKICHNHGYRFIKRITNGLSGARNECIEESEAELIHYIDDDTILPSDFIDQTIACFSKDEDLYAFGGKVIPDWRLVDKPKWFYDGLLGFLSMVDWGEEEKEFGRGGVDWLAGANTCFSKEVLKKFGGFDLNLGRKGGTNSLLGSEENELLRKIQKEHKVIYNPLSKLNHIIQPERMSQSWFIKRIGWGTTSDMISNCPWGKFNKASVAKNINLLIEDSDNPEVFKQKMQTAQEITYGIFKEGLE